MSRSSGSSAHDGWNVSLNPTVAAAKAQMVQMNARSPVGSRPSSQLGMTPSASSSSAAPTSAGGAGVAATGTPTRRSSSGTQTLPGMAMAPRTAAPSAAGAHLVRKISALSQAHKLASLAKQATGSNKQPLPPMTLPRMLPVALAAAAQAPQRSNRPLPPQQQGAGGPPGGVALMHDRAAASALVPGPKPPATLPAAKAAAKFSALKTAATSASAPPHAAAAVSGHAAVAAAPAVTVAIPSAPPADARLLAYVCTPHRREAESSPLPDTSSPHYATALAHVQSAKSVDVVLLSNPECAPLLDALRDDLQRLQYVVAVRSEQELAAELDDASSSASTRFAFLRSSRIVVWTMTSHMWSHSGCTSAARTANTREGMDVALVRLDGSMWFDARTGAAMNFPSYDDMSRYETGTIFASKAVEHLAPYYAAFVDKMVDRLGQPTVVVDQYVKRGDSLQSNARGMLRVLQQCQRGDADEARTAVGTAALVMQRWVEMYGMSDATAASASTTSQLSSELSAQLLEALLRHWTILEKHDVDIVAKQMQEASDGGTDASATALQHQGAAPLTAKIAAWQTHLLWTLFTVVRGAVTGGGGEAMRAFYRVDMAQRLLVTLFMSRQFGFVCGACFALLLQLCEGMGCSSTGESRSGFLAVFTRLHGGELVRSVALAHLDQMDTALHAVLLLRALLDASSPSSAGFDALAMVGGAVAYPTLVRYPLELSVQRMGWLLWAAQPLHTQLDLLRAGALSQLALTLQTHATDRTVARLALRLLQSCVREQELARAAMQYGAVEGMLAAAAAATTAASSQAHPADTQLLSDIAQVLGTLVAQWKLDTVAWFAQRSPLHAQALALLAAQPGVGPVPAQLASRLAEVGPTWSWPCVIPYNPPSLSSVLELGDTSSFSTAAAPGGAPVHLLDSRGQAIARKYDVFLSHRQVDSQDLIKALKIQLERDGYVCFLDRDDAGLLSHLPTIVKESRRFIFVMSTGIFQSKWCAQELQTALDVGVHVTLVRQDGATWGSREEGTFSEEWPQPSAVVPEYATALATLRRRYDANPTPHAVLSHSVGYFAQFYQDLVAQIGGPQIRFQRMVNGEKSLLENLRTLASLFDGQDFKERSGSDKDGKVGPNESGDKTQTDSSIVACASNLVRLVSSGKWDAFNTASIDAQLWTQVASCALEQLKRSGYEIKLYLDERVRHLTTLIDFLGALVQLHRGTLASLRAGGMFKYLCWILRDYGSERRVVTSFVRVCYRIIVVGSTRREGDGEQQFRGQLGQLDAIVCGMTGGRDPSQPQANDALALLLGSIAQLAQPPPPHPRAGEEADHDHVVAQSEQQQESYHPTVLLGLQALVQLQSLSEGGSLPLSAPTLLPSLARGGYANFLREHMASYCTSVAGTVAATASPSAAQLVAQLSRSFDQHGGEAWYGASLHLPVAVLKVRTGRELDAQPKAARVYQSATIISAAVSSVDPDDGDDADDTSLDVRDPSDVEREEAENASRPGPKLFIVHSPSDAAACALLERLSPILFRAGYTVVEQGCTALRDLPHDLAVLLLSPGVLRRPEVRSWVAQKDKGKLLVVLVEGSRWDNTATASSGRNKKAAQDGVVAAPAASNLTSRYPPPSLLPVSLRSKLLVHSEHYWSFFFASLLQRLPDPSAGWHRRVHRHLDLFVPRVTRLLRHQAPHRVEAHDGALARLLRVLAGGDGDGSEDPFKEVRELVRSMPLRIWHRYVDALLHRLCLVNSLPLEQAGRKESVRTLLRCLRHLVRFEDLAIHMRGADALRLNALIHALYTYRDDVSVLHPGAAVLAALLHYTLPIHTHDNANMVWVANDRPGQTAHCQGQCKTFDRVGVLGRWDCVRCMDEGDKMNQLCERCYYIQPERNLYTQRAHHCADGAVRPLRMVTDRGERVCTKPNCAAACETASASASATATGVTRDAGAGAARGAGRGAGVGSQLRAGRGRPNAAFDPLNNAEQQRKDEAAQQAWSAQLGRAAFICDTCPSYAECMLCFPRYSQIALSISSAHRVREVVCGEKLVLTLLSCLRLRINEKREEDRQVLSDARCSLAAVLDHSVPMRTYAYSIGALSLSSLGAPSSAALALNNRADRAVLSVRTHLQSIAAARKEETRHTEFPLMFVYDRTDASEAARSVLMSLETSLPSLAPVWDESSSVHSVDPERVVDECRTAIVLLTPHALSNPLVLSCLRRSLASGKIPLLIKMDGVTWENELYPPLHRVPADLRHFFAQAIAASMRELEGNGTATSSGSSGSGNGDREASGGGADASSPRGQPASIVRYSRDYFAAFLSNLLQRLEGRASPPSGSTTAAAAQFPSYFHVVDPAAHLGPNIARLQSCLLVPTWVEQYVDELRLPVPRVAPARTGVGAAAAVVACESDGSGFDASTYAFQSHALSFFAALYDNDELFRRAHPGGVSADQWQAVVRTLLTRISDASRRIRESGAKTSSAAPSSGGASPPTHTVLLRCLDVLGLLCRHPYVRDWIHGGLESLPLLSALDPDTRKRVLGADATEMRNAAKLEEELSRGGFCGALYADLYAALRSYTSMRDWVRATHLLRSWVLICRAVDLHHWVAPHPSRPFDPLLHVLSTMRFDALFVDLLLAAVQARYGPGARAIGLQQRRDLGALLAALMPVLANCIRLGAFDAEHNFLRMQLALQFLLLQSFPLETSAATGSGPGSGPSVEAADTALVTELLLCMGCAIRSNGGLHVQPMSGGEAYALDAHQLCTLLYSFLVRTLRHSSLSSASPLLSSCFFALSQLVFYSPDARGPLADSHVVLLADQLFFALNPAAGRSGGVAEASWLLLYLFNTLVDVCNASGLLTRLPLSHDDDDTAKRPSILAALDEKQGSSSQFLSNLIGGIDRAFVNFSAATNVRVMLARMVAATSQWFRIAAAPSINLGDALHKAHKPPIKPWSHVVQEARPHPHQLRLRSRVEFECDVCGSWERSGHPRHCDECDYNECTSCFLHLSAGAVHHPHPLSHRLDSDNARDMGTYACAICMREGIKGEIWQCLHADCCTAQGQGQRPYAECTWCYPFATGKSAERLKRTRPDLLHQARVMQLLQPGDGVQASDKATPLPPAYVDLGTARVVSLPTAAATGVATAASKDQIPPAVSSKPARTHFYFEVRVDEVGGRGHGRTPAPAPGRRSGIDLVLLLRATYRMEEIVWRGSDGSFSPLNLNANSNSNSGPAAAAGTDSDKQTHTSPFALGDTCGLGVDVASAEVYATSNGVKVASARYFNDSMGFPMHLCIRMGAGGGDAFTLNTGQNPFVYAPANQQAVLRPDLVLDSFGPHIEVLDEGIGLRVRSGADAGVGGADALGQAKGTWAQVTTPIVEQRKVRPVGAAAAAAQGADAAGGGSASDVLQLTENILTSDLVQQVHPLLAAASQPFSPDLVATVSPPASAVSVDLCAIRAAQVAAQRAKMQSLLRAQSIPHVLHEHELQRIRPAAWKGTTAVCNLCSKPPSSVSPTAFLFGCVACEYIECLHCFLANSGLVQLHVHELRPAVAPLLATAPCALCCAPYAVGGEAGWRSCVERSCVWNECSQCTSRRNAAAEAANRARVAAAAAPTAEATAAAAAAPAAPVAPSLVAQLEALFDEGDAPSPRASAHLDDEEEHAHARDAARGLLGDEDDATDPLTEDEEDEESDADGEDAEGGGGDEDEDDDDEVFPTGDDPSNPWESTLNSRQACQLHRHQLRYQRHVESTPYTCAECDKEGDHFVYVCPRNRKGTCSYSVHPACFLPGRFNAKKVKQRQAQRTA